MPKMIPCRYIGEHKVHLNKYGGPYFNAQNQQILDLQLEPGDTLMMPDTEVLGFSVILDPNHEKDPLHLGSGKVVLPEHQGKSDEELQAIGYQFHQGRPDFCAIDMTPKRKEKVSNDNSTN